MTDDCTQLKTILQRFLGCKCSEEPSEEPPVEPPVEQPSINGELNINLENGLMDLYINTLHFMKMTKEGHGPGYSYWAGTSNEVTANGFMDYTVTGTNARMSFDELIHVKKINDNVMEWDYKVTTHEQLDTLGAFMQFTLNRDSEPNLKVTMLENNTGFEMSGFVDFPEDSIIVQFDKPLHSVNFERPTNTSLIRAYFLGPQIEPGELNFKMTVTVPDEILLDQTPEEQLGPVPDATWDASLIDFMNAPVDLSFLNHKPAGSKGRLKAVGDQLVFDDGTVGKFWGTNLSSHVLFGRTDEEIEAHAKRLAKLGYNMARIHHHDSYWVNPNIFGYNYENTLSIAQEMIRRIDKWVECLKAEGIYIWLDMEVQRKYTANDGIQNWDEISKGAGYITGHGWNYTDEDIHRLQKDFMSQYLGHVNEYTGLSYAEDPAIAWIQFYNENDLTFHFGHKYLSNQGVPNASEKWMSSASTFAIANGLNVVQTQQTWVPGPAKLFANEMEHRNNVKMTTHARSLGYEGIMSSTSQWASQPQYCLASLAEGDIVDVHSYGRFNDVSYNPRHRASFHHFIGASNVCGKPLSISEWSIEPIDKSYDRFVSPIQIATQACFHGWDVPMHFGYSGSELSNHWGNGTYTSYGDPCWISMLTVGALMYRQGHVSPANETYTLAFNYDDHYGKHLSPKNSKTIRTLLEQHRVEIKIPEHPSLPWFESAPATGTVVTNPNIDFIPDGNSVTFDTGEVTRNWEEGTLIVDTPKSQVLSGWIGDRELSTSDVLVSISNNIGAVAVQSYTDDPITESDHISISLASRTVYQSNKTFLSEEFTGFITIRAKSGMKLYKVDKFGVEAELPVTYQEGVYMVNLDASLDTYWMKLRG